MALSKAERERVTDSMLKLQSAAKSLKKVSRREIPNFEDIESCLKDADKSLKSALTAADHAGLTEPTV